MRVHNSNDQDEPSATNDHAVFWPIGQTVFAQVVRELLDDHCARIGKDSLSDREVIEALRPLRRVEWSLHEVPWKQLLLVQAPDKNNTPRWGMRNEGRSSAVAIARQVIEFIVGVSPLDELGQDELRQKWTANLVPVPNADEANCMWDVIRSQALSP